MDTQPMQMSKWTRSKLLAKGAWATFKADKELVAMPILNFLVTAMFVVIIIATVILTGAVQFNVNNTDTPIMSNGFVTWPIFITAYIIITAIAHFFEAGIYAGALARFNGEDPTIRSSLATVKKRIRPLLLFSLLMSTVGLVLQLISERVPFAGKIAIWLFGAAWNIANFFAIPVLLTSEKEIKNPIDATKQSIQVIKKVWGESVMIQLGFGAVALLFVVGVIVFGALLGALLGAIVPAGLVGVVAVVPVLMMISFFALIFIFTTLGTIVKAALYHYATTGESPEHFSKELLRQTITPKKSRKIFAGN